MVIIFLFAPACVGEEEEPGPESFEELTLIGNDSSLALSDPSWFSDGSHLLVSGVSECDRSVCDQGIYILNVESRGLKDFGLRNIYKPDWRSNPGEISYVNIYTSEIFMNNLDNSNPMMFAIGQGIEWSGDGEYAAIVRHTRVKLGLSKTAVYIKNFDDMGDGTKVFETPESLESEITGLAWTHNNEWLALSARWKVDGNYRSAIYLVNRADQERIFLGDDMEEPGWMPSENWLFYIKDQKLGFSPQDFSCEVFPLGLKNVRSPAISPDGDQIAFEHDSKIYLLDLDKIWDKLVC